MRIRIRQTRDTITPEIKRALKSVRDPRPSLEAMGLAVVSITQRNFTQSRYRPAAWPPLKAKTIKAKAKAGKSNRPLVGEGLLARSPRVVSVDRRRVVIGSDRPYASYHQLGTRRVPARPFFPFTRSGNLTPAARRVVLAALKGSLKIGRQ